MRIIKDKIDIAIDRIDENTKLFYQNKIDEGYAQLDETLRIIGIAIDDILRFQKESKNESASEAKLVQVLTEAMNALEVRDTLLLSDILLYELKEVFNEIREELI